MGGVTPPISAAALSPPEPIHPDHDLGPFDSGVPALDEWLRKRALANDAGGASRTYVVAAGGVVVGYYCLSTASILAADAPGSVRRNMPDPIPAMLLGRLAVDKGWAGRGLGAALLRDAARRTVQVSEIVGIRALLVHAIDDTARRFYERYGFTSAPGNPLTLMVTVPAIRKAMGL